MSDLNRVAATYLKNFLDMRVIEEEAAKIEQTEINRLMLVYPEVLLTRMDGPRFLAGFLPSGRAIWTDDHTKAGAIPGDQIHHYEQRLGILLFPMWA
jgi:hypothetical protein